MEFDRLLGMAKRRSERLMGELYGMIDQGEEIIYRMVWKIINLDEGDADDQKKRRCDIMNCLGCYMQKKLAFPEEYFCVFRDIYNNCVIQGIFGFYYYNSRFLSYSYESCIEYLAKKIDMPEIQKDSSLIQDLVKKIGLKDALLNTRDSHFRIKASQGSGIDAMHRCRKEKELSVRGGRAKVAEYELAYVELISILKSIVLLEKKNITNRTFWEKLKDWGKIRIVKLVDGSMGLLYRQYQELKVYENKMLSGKEGIYIDDFLMEMAKVHEQYSKFILTGELTPNSLEKFGLYNNKFHFYLYLMYEYVRYYSKPSYKYLALYSLEFIYVANTIIGIWSQGNRVPIHREYVPTKKYFQPDSEGWTIWSRNKKMANERMEAEYKNNEKMFHIYKLVTAFYQSLFAKVGILKGNENKKRYEENLLMFINQYLDEWPQDWGMIPGEYYPSTKIDFYQWIIYRPFVLEAGYFKSPEEFFGDAYQGKRMLDFVYDWKCVEDENEIENAKVLLKECKLLNDQKAIESIIKKCYKNSDCDRTIKEIRDMYKDTVEPEEAILNYVLNERKIHNQKHFDIIQEFLAEYNLTNNQEAINSISSQIYKGKSLGKTLEKICDNYIEEYREYGENNGEVSIKEINSKMGIKVQDYKKIMWNIYYKMYDEPCKIGVKALMKKYKLSWRQPLIQKKDVQTAIKSIVHMHKVDNSTLRIYSNYLRCASWLPKEDVDFMFGKVLS